MRADLDAANAEANRLAKQLEATSLEAQDLAAAADELLSLAEAELKASRAERNRLQAEVADALAEHGRLLASVEHLEDALERSAASLDERERTAETAARESATLRAGFDADLTRLLNELETARTDLENARSEIELVHNELETLKSEAARGRAAFSAERHAAQTEQDRLVAELEAARTHAEWLVARNAQLEAAFGAHGALLDAVQSVTGRRTTRRRSLSHLGTWLLPPTRTKLGYLRRYLALRRSGEFDVDSYLLANPDVLAEGINPLMHYVQYGRAEGRAVAGYVEPPVTAHAVEAASSDAVDTADEPALSTAVAVWSAGAEELEDNSNQNAGPDRRRDRSGSPSPDAQRGRPPLTI